MGWGKGRWSPFPKNSEIVCKRVDDNAVKCALVLKDPDSGEVIATLASATLRAFNGELVRDEVAGRIEYVDALVEYMLRTTKIKRPMAEVSVDDLLRR